MNLQFLGTSAGMPTRERNLSGLALSLENERGWYLVDCGEGTQHRLLQTPFSARSLKAVFITHAHGDHCYGLPGLLASAAMGGRTAPLPIIGPAALADWLAVTWRCSGASLPFATPLVAVEALPEWSDGAVQVSTLALSHRLPSFAFRFTELGRETRLDTARLEAEGIPQGPLWGQLQAGRDGEYAGRLLRAADYLVAAGAPRRIIVCGDNDRPELLAPHCAGVQVLVHEATYTLEQAARVGPEVGHCAAGSIAAFAQAAGLPNLLLTHFSPRYQSDRCRSPSVADLEAEAAARYRGRLFLAEDLARYRLERSGLLQLLA